VTATTLVIVTLAAPMFCSICRFEYGPGCKMVMAELDCGATEFYCMGECEGVNYET
jgi:hypothetical protein